MHLRSFLISLASFLALLVMVYVAWIAVLYVQQRDMLFPGVRLEVPEGSKLPARGESVWLDVYGSQVEAWFLPGEASTAELAPTILFVHGNRELMDEFADRFWVFRQAGVNVMLLEYPGYGRSEGFPTQETLSETVRMGYDYLLSRDDIDKHDIVGMGRAMGAGPLCAVAGERHFAALILQSTFTSITDVAAQYLAPPIVVRDPFNNLEALRNYHGPVMIAHGQNDRLVGYAHGLKLAREGEAHMITWNCRHEDCPPDWNVYQEDVLNFLRYHGLLDSIN